MKNYRVRRPKKYDELLNLLKDKDLGVFSNLKSALVFSAAVGFKIKRRVPFKDSAEPIALNIFNENYDQPFIYAMALTEYKDVSYLQEDKFLEVFKVFEEYACGGLEYLDETLNKSHLKESIEGLISDKDEKNIINDISNLW